LEDHDAVTLTIHKEIQGEGDDYWAVKKNRLHVDDPPVDCYSLDDVRGEVGRRVLHRGPFAPHVTSFVFEHQWINFDFGWEGYRRKGAGSRLLEQLDDAFLTHVQFGDIHVFEITNTVLFIGPSRYPRGHWQLKVGMRKNTEFELLPKVLKRQLR
jgi:hypothetical protein